MLTETSLMQSAVRLQKAGDRLACERNRVRHRFDPETEKQDARMLALLEAFCVEMEICHEALLKSYALLNR